jgi:hypothetical protein
LGTSLLRLILPAFPSLYAVRRVFGRDVFDEFDTICTTGIILFTYHKYRRSIESAVPLDSHGNPISTDDGLHEGSDEQRGEFVELGETVPLTSDPRTSYDFEEVTWILDATLQKADSVASHRM